MWSIYSPNEISLVPCERERFSLKGGGDIVQVGKLWLATSRSDVFRPKGSDETTSCVVKICFSCKELGLYF